MMDELAIIAEVAGLASTATINGVLATWVYVSRRESLFWANKYIDSVESAKENGSGDDSHRVK